MQQIREYLSNISAAAVGSNERESAIGVIVAIIGAAGTALGGWDKGMIILIILMAGDYITGVLGAIKTKTVNSDVMYWGGIRKIVVLFVIYLAYAIDGWMHPDAPIFRTLAIYFYVGREGLSVIENLGTLNVPLPQKMKDVLQQLNEKGEGKSG
ncbi:phage holin family protein [Paenibacillus alkaliterrae]|uniref:phage holin family protein n=1 Tax=Paenibacillus alkaliterrae TaxID=320909 RepID=UPI001F47D7B2|nr:phage holin family protein [Paenibacillus alkaliterrae]MCF2939054.1 phage holin family protein [Paenibacillus alkaliterrae]